MNYQEYQAQKRALKEQIKSLQRQAGQLESKFIESMQAQGWAYINSEETSYGETTGLSARLLSPAFLERHGATRETIEGKEYYLEGKNRYVRYRVENFPIEWEYLYEEEEVIYL